MTEKKESSIRKSVVDNNLKDLVSHHKGVYAAMLSSIDGHFIAKYASDEIQNSKLSSMTSSCLALGERIAMESGQNGCDFVIIQNQNGIIVLKRVGKKLVLTSMARENINLGMLLSATRKTAEILYDEID